MSYNPNAKPCFLHGCDPIPSTDGSTICSICGVYCRPDPKMVNALLRANAGGKEYARQAEWALRLAGMSIPPSPPPIDPTEPPLYVAANGSTDLPSLWVVLPACLFLGSILGLTLWRFVQVWSTL